MVLSCWKSNQEKNPGFAIIEIFFTSRPACIVLTPSLGFEKNLSWKKAAYIFPTNTLFEKMKAYLWSCSKFDLTGKYAVATDDKASDLSQVKKQAARIQVRGLLGLSVFQKIQELLIQLVVGMHIAFIIVENPALLALLGMFSSTLVAWILSNGNILRSWIMKAFENRKLLLAESMPEARSNIHLSFDIWTSNNSIAVVAIVAHYIDDNMKLQTTLIGLRWVFGSHSGEVVAEQVVQVIQEYGFEQKLRYFVLDNATSNDRYLVQKSME